MYDERTALLAAIKLAPTDDIPRLVYADWLDEYGTECDRATAELIRMGCKLQTGPGGLEPEEAAFVERNWKLLVPHLADRAFRFDRRTGSHLFHFSHSFVPFSKAYASFWRGFATYASSYTADYLLPVGLVALSQPLAFIETHCAVVSRNGAYGVPATAFASTSYDQRTVWQHITGHDAIVPDFESGVQNKIFFGGTAEINEGRARRAVSDAIHAWANAELLATPAGG